MHGHLNKSLCLIPSHSLSDYSIVEANSFSVAKSDTQGRASDLRIIVQV